MAAPWEAQIMTNKLLKKKKKKRKEKKRKKEKAATSYNEKRYKANGSICTFSILSFQLASSLGVQL